MIFATLFVAVISACLLVLALAPFFLSGKTSKEEERKRRLDKIKRMR